ncbi:MAG: IS21 family transposase [Deltaproteobacteria bacterium]|nr:IS21 family transposase [Deltaproteobacteria bacterium]
MAKKRKSPEMLLEIQKLRLQGVSVRKIAQALDIHRNTVRHSLDPGDPCYLPPEVPPDTAGEASWESGVVWENLLEEIRRGVPVKILWQESGLGVGYSGFWKACRKRLPVVPEISIKLDHVPGERVFFDYCDGLAVTEPDGGIRKTHLFVGALPFSALTGGDFVYDQKLPSFLRSQERFFASIGGVVPYVVIDNLKSGVTKAHRYDPDVNKTYCDFAGHYGFAVLPARPVEPRDKAAVEAAIGVIQRCFFPKMRNRPGITLAELNREFAVFLKELNAQVMKDHGVSRNDRFETEKPKLLALPQTRFEISEWREASVHPDCHVQVMKNFYSVPFAFVGRTVRVRISARLVEIFDNEGSCITAHVRSHLEHRYSTDVRHYPEAQAACAFFDVHQASLQAARVGPGTEALITKLLSGTHPLKYLRRCQGILRLAKGKQHASVEYAAKIALATNNLRLDFIRAAALHHERFGPRPVASTAARAPIREPESVFLHENEQPTTQERKQT